VLWSCWRGVGGWRFWCRNPLDGQELYWHNTRTVPKPYKGPREIRFEQDFSPHHDVKLALTSWAHGAFDVLHLSPGSRLQHSSPRCGWDAQQVKVAGGGTPAAVQHQQLQQAVVQHVQHMLQQQVNEVQQLVLQHLVQQPVPVQQPDLVQPGQLALGPLQQAAEQTPQQQQRAAAGAGAGRATTADCGNISSSSCHSRCCSVSC